jgi:hypothetical protein
VTVWAAIGDQLTGAIAIAIAPLALMTATQLVTAQRGRLRTMLFALGWALSIMAVAGIAYLIADAGVDHDVSDTEDGINVVQLVFGVGLWAVAAWTWRSRNKPEDQQPATKVLNRVRTLTPIGAFGVGVAQGLAIAKNIPLALTAGAQLRVAGLPGAQAVIVLVVFAVVATAGIVAPLVVVLFGGTRAVAGITAFNRWLTDSAMPITLVVTIFVGAILIGKGLRVL